MTQKQVLEAIKKEREYQKEKWSTFYDDSKWTIEDWTGFILEYLPNSKNPVKVRHPEYTEKTQLIKVAALAVAALETME